MATLNTKVRVVPKEFRNKRIYTGSVIYSSTATAQGDDAEPEGYTAGTGLELIGNEFAVEDGGIDTTQLAADAVDGTKIADDAIDSEHITDGSIDTIHLSEGAAVAIQMDSTPEDPGGVSTGVQVASFDIDPDDIEPGDAFILKMGAICSGVTGSSWMGVGCRNYDGADIDGFPNGNTPAVYNSFAAFISSAIMVIQEYHLYILSTTKCAWQFKYQEPGESGGAYGHDYDAGVVTLVNTTFGQAGSTLTFTVHIKDDSGSDEVEYQFAHLTHIKKT